VLSLFLLLEDIKISSYISYTLILTYVGYKVNDVYDCSGRAHVFLAPKRVQPPPGTDRDLRRYPVIVKDGLDGTHNKIEDIKPLAQTVLHELLHAIGGCKFSFVLSLFKTLIQYNSKSYRSNN
jgi:hypothetical protein